MGRDIEVPVLRMELTGIKYQVVSMLETRHGEMQAAIETGITMAYQQLPSMVAERVRAGILEAAAQATCAAMQEYFGPGGRGYQRILADITEQIEGKEVGAPQPDPRYVVGPEQEKDYRLVRDRCTLEEAFGLSPEEYGALMAPGSNKVLIHEVKGEQPAERRGAVPD